MRRPGSSRLATDVRRALSPLARRVVAPLARRVAAMLAAVTFAAPILASAAPGPAAPAAIPVPPAPTRTAGPPPGPPGPPAASRGGRAAVELPSGVRYVDLEPGEGDPAKRGQRVTVHLVGALESGEVVVSTRERRRPMRFRLGDGEVISGLEEGIEGMRSGGRRKVVVPPGAAYGRRGVAERVPPDSVLVFEIELLEIR